MSDMYLSDVCFSDAVYREVLNKNKTSVKKRGGIPRVECEENLLKLKEYVNASGALNYYEISEHMGFATCRVQRAGKKFDIKPLVARKYSLELIKRFPQEFELIYLPHKSKMGRVYQRPHIKKKED